MQVGLELAFGKSHVACSDAEPMYTGFVDNSALLLVVALRYLL